MKKLVLVIILAYSAIIAKGQNAFYDAQFLNTIKQDELNNILQAITSQAIVLSGQEKATLDAYNKFISNPFDNSIKAPDLNIAYLKSAILKYNDYVQKDFEIKKYTGTSHYTAKSTDAAIASLTSISSLATGGFGLTADQQTMIIDGLVKYYAAEFKKAQLLTYIQLMNETIGKVGELKVLFPKTYDKILKADPSKFPDLGSEYKSIFNEDMKSLPDNLINHIDNYKNIGNSDANFIVLTESVNSTIKKNEYYVALKISRDIGTKLVNNYSAVDLFNYIDNTYYPKLSASNNLSDKTIQLLHNLNLLQKNLLDTTRTKENSVIEWLNFEKLKKLTTLSEWQYFAGLIYQQDPDAFDKVFPGVSAAGAFSAAEIKKIQDKIRPIASALIELQSFKANLKDENLKENFLPYMQLVLNVVKSVNYNDDKVDEFIKLSEYTFNLYDNARKKDYNNSIYYTGLILDEFLTDDQKGKFIDVLTNLEKYGTFMTDVINAKNADEVKDVITKNVAPATSFILKREYINTLSVTGQPGYFVGYENLNGTGALNSGITLPMGFEFTTKDTKGPQNSASWGFFAQLVDLGAALNFRTGDATSALPDKVEFKQFFSPGFSIDYGFKNSPLTIAAGYQHTPSLREITLAGGNQFYPTGDRFFIRFAFDIPLINIAKSQGK